MPAAGSGYNKRITIWSMDAQADDEVGGSIVSGSKRYEGVPARVKRRGNTMDLLGQGYQTPGIFLITCQYKADINERDEIEITSPYNADHINKRFRIIELIPSDHNPTDPRAKWIITATHVSQGRSTQ